MGEKGNAAAAGAAVAGAAGAVAPAAQSLIERTTTHTTESVVAAGSDYADTVRDKVIESGADHTIAEARERLRRGEGAGGDDDAGGAESAPADQG